MQKKKTKDLYLEPAWVSKFRVFWDVALYCHAEVDRRFKGVYCLHHQGDDGDSTHFCHIGKLQRDYTALHPRRL
jgi:hypothetical protein